MATVQELIAQKEALERQIAEAQRQAKADGIAKVRALMTEHGLTVADLSSPAPARASRQEQGRSEGGAQVPGSRDGQDMDGPRCGAEVDRR